MRFGLRGDRMDKAPRLFIECLVHVERSILEHQKVSPDWTGYYPNVGATETKKQQSIGARYQACGLAKRPRQTCLGLHSFPLPCRLFHRVQAAPKLSPRLGPRPDGEVQHGDDLIKLRSSVWSRRTRRVNYLDPLARVLPRRVARREDL